MKKIFVGISDAAGFLAVLHLLYFAITGKPLIEIVSDAQLVALIHFHLFAIIALFVPKR